ncbi:2OG-Fe(II) oxygenase [Nodosilinea sp. LEGE 07088]|uniref:2OG-Fe(II) oxygenase n=1 Tax=Nodosilinea sp. LEGE 07088 TaxID=2777968 RepID=UPI0018818A98|nr:2OG-Fe(II) oxygenase [Nodosilinea sp. LEGE 07088]MBE9137881.1 2OG-Fe(II) oxygenase [Nodosilinea sp. LEGE 07088]
MSNPIENATSESFGTNFIVQESALDLEFTLPGTLARLRQETPTLKEQYNSGKPFPHLVIDGLFPEHALSRIVHEFPREDQCEWLTWHTKNEQKKTSRGTAGVSIFTQLFCFWLNSTEFIEQIKQITGIDDLVPDPTFFGAGLHEMGRDGWLNLHADYTQHPIMPLTRRVNLLIYLNHDWELSWGGDLVLQDPIKAQQRASYPPLFNCTIIFPTTTETLHGVPQPLSCPMDRSRKLISIYYWSPIASKMRVGSPIIWSKNNQARNRVSWTGQKLVKFSAWKFGLEHMVKKSQKPQRK